MRIAMDLQGAQGASRHRGIGRYSLALAQAIARNRGSHEVLIALNGLFLDTIEPIRAAFDGLLPQENIRVWHAPYPLAPLDPANTWRRHTAELIREAFLASLKPDIVHITSLFEGFVDDAVHSIGLSPTPMPTAMMLYDLIPLVQGKTYLKTNPKYEVFYQEKLGHLKRADLYLAISESSRQEAIEHLRVAEEQVVNISAAVNENFKPVEISLAEEKAIRQRFGLTRPFLMYSGATDERKNHLRLIEAFSISSELSTKYQLAIVGHMPDDHRRKFETYAKMCGLKPTDVVITGMVSDKEMARLYNLCALFVFPAWHEGFGLPALEAMSCGAPVIGANTSSVPEVIGRADALFDPFDAKAISQKIAEVLCDDRLRGDLARHGLEQAKKFSWDESAKRAISAFEQWHAKRVQVICLANESSSALTPAPWLIDKIARLQQPSAEERDWLSTARAIAQNHPPSAERQLLVDISEFVHRDAKTGIQRVVRSVLAELLASPPRGFRVEPVYAIQHKPGYRYARKFTQQFLKASDAALADDCVEVFSNDIFLGLDLQHHVVLQQAAFYTHLRHIGAPVYFVVYDLLPVLLPEMFPDGTSSIHAQWLGVLAQTDGVVCISRAVADEMREYLNIYGPHRLRPFNVGWFHLGADVARSVPTKDLLPDASCVLGTLSRRPTFLMVGTIEPRKGQMQALRAFKRLWNQGVDVNLVIVGKHGWNVDLLVEMLRTDSELGRRLFWLEGISDEYLEKVYAASTCLIAASEGEGFGLPLIEAAQHKLPIIARDIPVFREVAGEHAFYFSGNEPESLAVTVQEWLRLYQEGKARQSMGMPWITWKQSTQSLLDVILGGDWYRQWMPDETQRYWGGDPRLYTQVGERFGLSMRTTGQAGFLLYGPYIVLPAGHYRIVLRGSASQWTGQEWIDVACDKGERRVLHASLETMKAGKWQYGAEFALETAAANLEFRFWVEGGTRLAVDDVELAPVTDAVFPGHPSKAPSDSMQAGTVAAESHHEADHAQATLSENLIGLASNPSREQTDVERLAIGMPETEYGALSLSSSHSISGVKAKRKKHKRPRRA